MRQTTQETILTPKTRFAVDARRPKAMAMPRSVLVGLVGKAIGLSRSPAMHEMAGSAQDLRLVYRLFDTDAMGDEPPSLGEIIRAAEIAGFAGLNVTYPYKIEAMEFLDEISDASRMVGAVNTILFRDGKRFGHNTDMWGFAESFRQRLAGVATRRVVQLGAGGAGAAVANALLDLGVETLALFDPDTDRGTELASRLCRLHGAGRAVLIDDLATFATSGIDGVVNASPVGMAKLPGSPFPVSLLKPQIWVADIVYFPLETELLSAAKAAGCRVMNGSGMALYQAVRAFELFTGLKPDMAVMEATFAAFDAAT